MELKFSTGLKDSGMFIPTVQEAYFLRQDETRGELVLFTLIERIGPISASPTWLEVRPGLSCGRARWAAWYEGTEEVPSVQKFYTSEDRF